MVFKLVGIGYESSFKYFPFQPKSNKNHESRNSKYTNR